MSEIPTSTWYTRPVFISSTFNDMQAERDWLRDIVFKGLSQQLKGLQIDLEPVDLRWGVETDNASETESKELLVLKVCLDEIERCRPFLIVLIGDRYGWIPPAKRMQDAVNQKGLTLETAGMSVTALEIEYGVFENLEQQPRAFFYFREIDNIEDMDDNMKWRYIDQFNPESTAKSAHKKLEELKKRIKIKIPDRTRTYHARWDKKKKRMSNLQEFGKKITEDISNAVKEELENRKIEIDESPEGKENALLEEFVESRTRWLRGRQDIIDKLKHAALIKENPGVICLVGETGSGKSSVFAKLYRELHGQADHCLVLVHAAGISPASTSLEAMLVKWTTQLQSFLQLETPVVPPEEYLVHDNRMKSSFWETQQRFQELLSIAESKTRIVCLFDALNQMEQSDIMRHMSWLPGRWPANAAFICTAIPGDETSAIEKISHGTIIPLAKLDEKEAKEIIEALYKKNHKQPNNAVINAVLQKEAHGIRAFENPLWLNLAMEHLLLLGEEDFRDAEKLEAATNEQKLHSLLIRTVKEFSPQVKELYFSLLDRARTFGNRIGVDWIEQMIGFLACSRYGLRREDLRLLLNAGNREGFELRFANAVNYFSAHLIERGPLKLIDFSHAQLRLWLREHLLRRKVMFKRHQMILASHFKKLESIDPLRQQEIMYHFMQGDEPYAAARYYGSELTEAEINFATQILAHEIASDTNVVQNKWLNWLRPFFHRGNTGMNFPFKIQFFICERFIYRLTDVLKDISQVEVQYKLLQSVRATLIKLQKKTSKRDLVIEALGACCNKLGDLSVITGRENEAQKYYLGALTVAKELSQGWPGKIEFTRYLLGSYGALADLYKAQGKVEEALAYYQKSLEIVNTLSKRYRGGAAFNRDLMVVYGRLGALSNFQQRLSYYEKATEIAENLHERYKGVASHSRDLATSYEKLGDVYLSVGNSKQALEYYEKALTIEEDLNQRFPASVEYSYGLSVRYESLGNVLTRLDQFPEAMKYYKEALKIRKELNERFKDNTEFSRNLAAIYDGLGELADRMDRPLGALTYYEDALEIRKNLSERFTSSVEVSMDLSGSYERLGDIYYRMDRNTEALEYLQKVLDIRTDLSERFKSNTEFSGELARIYGRVGDVVSSMGDTTQALQFYENALTIAKKVSRQFPGSIDFSRMLTACYERLGLFFRNNENYEKAMEFYRKALTIAEPLTRRTDDVEFKFSLLIMTVSMGDLSKHMGKGDNAFVYFRRSLEINKDLVQYFSGSRDLLAGLFTIYNKLCDLNEIMGTGKRLLAYYQKCLDITYDLHQRFPGCVDFNRGLALSHLKIAEYHLNRKEFVPASSSLQNFLEVIDEIKNSGMQLDKNLIQATTWAKNQLANI